MEKAIDADALGSSRAQDFGKLEGIQNEPVSVRSFKAPPCPPSILIEKQLNIIEIHCFLDIGFRRNLAQFSVNLTKFQGSVFFFPIDLRPRSYQSVATFVFPSRLVPSK